MSSALERERILSELAAVEAALTAIGGGTRSALERAGLQAKHANLTKELAGGGVPSSRIERAQATVLFGGRPVVSDREVEVDYAVESLRRYQQLVALIYASARRPTVPLRESGTVPDASDSRLTITGLAHGCFGFALAERVGSLLAEGSGVGEAMERASELVDAAADDDEAFASAVASTDPRVLKMVREWYEELYRRGGTIKLATRRRVVELNRSRVVRGTERTRRTMYSEQQTTEHVVCNAINDNGGVRLLRIQGEDGESVSARVSEDMPPAEFARLGSLWRRGAVAEMIESTITAVGKPKRSYVLKHLRPSQIDRLYVKLERMLEDATASHESREPNVAAVEAARSVVNALWLNHATVADVRADADGGVAVYAGDFPRRYVLVLCDNEGSVGAVAVKRDAAAAVWTWEAPDEAREQSMLAFAQKAQDWLRGEL